MKLRSGLLVVAGAFILAAATATACLWDGDTLAAESARFPGISLLVTGTFPRHSREFYVWRKGVSQEQLAKNPALVPVYDDLAVAQHKLGDHKGAIATMQAKEKIRPGLYETYSNLGTFYIYLGELEESLKWIDKALAINANAHFGREKYQRWLVEWVLETRAAAKVEGAAEMWKEHRVDVLVGYAAFVAKKVASRHEKDSELELSPDQTLKAIHGVAGMMRFADFNNPLLQEAMGDLLLVGDPRHNAAQMAALCYLHACDEEPDNDRKAILMAKVQLAGQFTHDFNMESLRQILHTSLAQGDRYFQSIREDEIAWVETGKDASTEFRRKYLQASR
ncbi:MAG: hypothetical protein ACO1TE_07945 [Prosthecobacter sp.]